MSVLTVSDDGGRHFGYIERMLDEALRHENIRPLKREEYDRLVDLGVFEGERIELLFGMLVEMSPQNLPHASTIRRLTELLIQLFAPAKRAQVRVQLPFVASDYSEPEPDLAVVPNQDDTLAHPSRAHLVIEVAATSLRKDRGLKARLYAASAVPEYWVVDTSGGIIEVHTEIVQSAYARITPYRSGDSIALQAFPDVTIAADDVLGK
jgi:Uma2 family endonuclease